MEPLSPADTVVITGAAGWLGTALMHRLADIELAGIGSPAVIATVASIAESEHVRRAHPEARIVAADVTSPDDWQLLDDAARLGTVDVVHTVGVIHPRRIADFHAVNELGTRTVVEAAQRAGVRRFVHVSSNSPFGTNPSPHDVFGEHEPYHPYLGYGTSKMAAELAVFDAVERGLDAVVVRPPWFYGPWQPARQTTFFSMVRAGRFPVFGDGDQRRSMVYVDNLVDGVLAACSAPGVAGRGYWIADAEPYRVTRIVDAVRAALEANGLECRDRTLRLPVAVARTAERVDRVLQARGRYQQQVHVLGEMAHTIAVDVGAATRDLGYEPRVGLEDGMRASVAWCLEQGFEL